MFFLSLVLFFAVVSSFPGPDYLHPKIHFTPPYVSDAGGWHDVAGAITHKGVHHIYQGTGWNHAFSNDLVHWKTGPPGPQAIHETYAGMSSFSTPCSGFITKDADGTICSGFRQCGSNKGIEGGAPWDVPLELRCALDDDLSNWTQTPEYIFNVSFYRAIPYDPARPWQEKDGYWYQLLSMDGCNTTTRTLPCEAGGALYMWKSPALRGEKAKWEKVGPVFTSAETVLPGATLTHEFVTIDYIGKLEGDDLNNGNTRLFLNNVGGNGGGVGCCSGTTSYFPVEQTSPGAPFTSVAPQGMVDWGAFTLKPSVSSSSSSSGIDLLNGEGSRGLSMARTLGSETSDQVTQPGRRVLIGWTGPADVKIYKGQGSTQSLPRDLSLSPIEKGVLLQKFVPELQNLRAKHYTLNALGSTVNVGIQAEIFASFMKSSCENGDACSISVMGDGKGNYTTITLSQTKDLVLIDATSQGNTAVRAGPLPNPDANGKWNIHAILDNALMEIIVNNRTAFVVYVAPSTPVGQVKINGGKANVEMWTLSDANNL